MRFWKTKSCHAPKAQLSWIQDRCWPRYRIRVRCSEDSHPAPIFSSLDFSSPVHAGERLRHEQVLTCKGMSENRYLPERRGLRSEDKFVESYSGSLQPWRFRIPLNLKKYCQQRREEDIAKNIVSVLLFIYGEYVAVIIFWKMAHNVDKFNIGKIWFLVALRSMVYCFYISEITKQWKVCSLILYNTLFVFSKLKIDI